jgi:outer membrane receptor protein involved in Fe transport
LHTRTTILILALLPSLGDVRAQAVRGTLTGIVTDEAREPVSGASVSIVHTETNRLRNAATDTLGEFTVPNLPPGEYRIEAEREGYRKHVRTVPLLMNQEVRVEIPLLAGHRTETVTVTAGRSLLSTETAALGGVVESLLVAGLPLDGRNFYELSLLISGVAPPAQGSAGSVRGNFAVNVNGAREDSNQFLLDGVFNGDPKLNGIGVSPPVDAVREVEVATSTYDASFGRNAGGQLSVVVNSGTNQFHGTAYEFLRNNALDARNFFAPAGEPSPKYQRNQFGFSVGGPIVRDRTFFFGDYEGRRVREGITRITNVPGALERTGNFSRSATYAIDPFTGQPFQGNIIPREYLNPVGVSLAALYPQPNRNEEGRNYVSSPVMRDRDDHFDARVDHRLSTSDDLASRYSFADRTLYEPFSGALTAVPGFGTDVPRRAQNAMARHTHIFTPALLNELTLGFSRVSTGVFQENMGRNINREVGLPVISTNPRDTGLSLISLTGYSRIGDESHNPQQGTSNIYQVSDTVAWVRGRHLVKAGVDLRRTQQNAYRDEMARGYLSFLGMTGNSLAEMLMGLPSLTGVARLDNHQHLRTHGVYGFVQDTWRARPDLTLSLGLRYEYNSPPVDAEDRANVYDVATQSLVQVGTGGIPRGGYLPDRNNWAPRVGLAWRPGQGRTVIRSGYGIYYDQSSLATGEGLYFNAPYFDFRLYFPFGQIPLTLFDPFPANFPITLPPSALAFQTDLRSAYAQHWDFSVQREIGRNRLVEAAYAGSKGTKLLGARDLNQPAPSAQQPNPRPVPRFDDINLLESRGNSSHHSLQARFQQTLRGGLSALASYTWSKSIDDASSFFASAGDPNFPQDSLNTRAERALSNFDLRHRFSLSYSYELPLGKGRWLGGWQTFGIWSFQTGRPFTVALISDLDNSNTGRSILGFGANDRPNVLRDPKLDHRTPERWFDTTAFALPPFGQFGNAGRNILTGPGYQSINISLVKNLALTERARLQFRTEAFNLLNNTNLDLPEIFVGTPGFGGIQSAGSPRRIQFGLKLLF